MSQEINSCHKKSFLATRNHFLQAHILRLNLSIRDNAWILPKNSLELLWEPGSQWICRPGGRMQRQLLDSPKKQRVCFFDLLRILWHSQKTGNRIVAIWLCTLFFAKLSSSRQLKFQLNWDSIITRCLPTPQPTQLE